MTSGFRYFSTVDMRQCNRAYATACLATAELRNLRRRDLFEQPLDHVFGRHPFGLGLKIRADAVAQHGDRDFLDVVDGDAEPAVHRGEGLAAVDEELPGAGAGAPIDQFLDELRGACRPWAAWPGPGGRRT